MILLNFGKHAPTQLTICSVVKQAVDRFSLLQQICGKFNC